MNISYPGVTVGYISGVLYQSLCPVGQKNRDQLFKDVTRLTLQRTRGKLW